MTQSGGAKNIFFLSNSFYYTIGTQKRAITPIDEHKYAALLHSLRPG